MDGFVNMERAWAEINISALMHNFRHAKATQKRVMCVLKADAYGHGALTCGKLLEQNGADAFAVTCLEEAVQLRQGKIELPILVLGYTSPEKALQLLKHHITQTVINEEHARRLNDAAQCCNKKLKVHIKMDTGMSRLGIMAGAGSREEEAVTAVIRISQLPWLDVEGMYTHFSAANTPSENEFTLWQYTRFCSIIDLLTAANMRPHICHISNSPGILYHPDTCIDMVRAGSLLYGMYPDGIPNKSGVLRPVMTLKAKIAQIKDLPRGTTVGYGRTFCCARDTKAAVVTAGYADGYPRKLSNIGYDVAHGVQCPSIGVVCMDLHCIDVTDLPEAAPGMETVLWGEGGMSLEEVATLTGLANCEVPCTVGGRVPRIYVSDEHREAVC